MHRPLEGWSVGAGINPPHYIIPLRLPPHTPQDAIFNFATELSLGQNMCQTPPKPGKSRHSEKTKITLLVINVLENAQHSQTSKGRQII
jgi:hypothetical protein